MFIVTFSQGTNVEVRCMCGDRYANYDTTEELFTQTTGCTVQCMKEGLQNPPYCGGYGKMLVFRTTSDSKFYALNTVLIEYV